MKALVIGFVMLLIAVVVQPQALAQMGGGRITITPPHGARVQEFRRYP